MKAGVEIAKEQILALTTTTRQIHIMREDILVVVLEAEIIRKPETGQTELFIPSTGNQVQADFKTVEETMLGMDKIETMEIFSINVAMVKNQVQGDFKTVE